MRPEKKSMVEELRTKLGDSVFVIFADYRGMSVAKTEDLRKKLRGVNASMQVVQNRMVGHVARELKYPGIDSGLEGPSAMVFGKGDVVQAAKVLKQFVKDNERPVVKIGALEGVLLSSKDIEQLASIPSREVLLAMFVGTVAAPLMNLVGVLQQKAASILYVLQAIQEKKEKQA